MTFGINLDESKMDGTNPSRESINSGRKSETIKFHCVGIIWLFIHIFDFPTTLVFIRKTDHRIGDIYIETSFFNIHS